MATRLIEIGCVDIEAIKDQHPLLSVVEPRVALKKRGGKPTGLCPFHEEKTPSFVVYESDQRYHCFGCGAHGDIFDFLEQMDGLDIRAAAEKLTGGTFPTYSPDRVEELRARRAAFEAEEARKRESAIIAARERWLGANPDFDAHPYLVRKKVGAHGLRLEGEKLLIPLYGEDGKIQTLQSIDPNGRKLFETDAPVTGGLFVIGGKVVSAEGPVLLCEGFATAATLHEATGLVTVCAFNSGNLTRVAARLAEKYPIKDYIVCGDDDRGKSRNAGREAAIEASTILKCRVVFPELPEGAGTDFNDMAAVYDRDTVGALVVDGLLPDGGQAPDPALEEARKTLGFDILDWSTGKFAGKAPPIQWLCENTIPQAVPALFASMGGVGKSFIALDLALEIAISVASNLGGRKILGGRVIGHGNVVVLNAEDSRDSIHRRLEKIDPSDRREQADGRVFIVPLPEVGGPMPLIAGGNGEFRQTDQFKALATQLRAVPNLKLVIIDPLQAFVTADVTSDPAAGQFMWSSFSQLCAETGATVIVCHHMRKEGSNRIVSADDAREAIRGSTALIDGARATYALWTASEDQTRRVCIEAGVDVRPKRVINGAVVKANDEHDWEIHTYLRADSGLLEDATEMGRRASTAGSGITEAQALLCLKEMDRRWQAGRPFSASSNATDRYIGFYMQREFRVSKEIAKRQLDDWFHAEMVGSETRDRKTKMVGLRVMKWPN